MKSKPGLRRTFLISALSEAIVILTMVEFNLISWERGMVGGEGFSRRIVAVK